MPDGGSLKVTAEHKNRLPFPIPNTAENNNNGWVKICITDSGPGIPNSDHEKIFEPFYSSKQQGSGLGLSTTYNIISEHKGTIKVGRKTGTGAVFTVYLPVKMRFVSVNKTLQEI
jgi:signal transduction histidine kinase